MKNENLLLTLGLTILATAAFAGCDSPELPSFIGSHGPDEVNAPTRPISPPPVQTFDLGQKENGDLNYQTFLNNKLFLWKDPTPPAVGAIILRAGDDIDVNEDLGIAARAKMKIIQDTISASIDRLKASLPDATKDAIDALYSLVDEQVTTATVAQFNETIAKTEADLAAANAALDAAMQGQPGQIRETLASLGRLGATRAKLDQTDPNRDTLQKQIDDLGKTLPTLPKAVFDAKSARDALLVTYEGNFRDRARSEALPKLIDDATKALPALPADAQTLKNAIDGLYGPKREQFQVQFEIAKRGDALVAMVINNTDYFNNTDMTVAVNFDSALPSVSMSGFPEKSSKLSTSNGAIDQVDYMKRKGRLHFDVHPAGMNQPFYRFKLGRVRTDVTDGRLFYQGSMDLCVPNSNCAANAHTILRHGIAKLVTSN